MTKIADILEGCGSYFNESWALLLSRLVTEISFSHRRTYALPAVRLLATIQIQNMTTSNAGIEKWGFSELLHRLNALPENEMLRIEEFDVPTFAVRCVFDDDSTTLLGCTIVKKRQELIQAPPAWDGSLEALKRSNKSLDE